MKSKATKPKTAAKGERPAKTSQEWAGSYPFDDGCEDTDYDRLYSIFGGRHGATLKGGRPGNSGGGW